MDNLIHADCLDAMATMDAESIDAVVTDPPYGLGFMGKAWDHGQPGIPFWAEMLRVAKPGAHLLAFGGTRTVHRLAAAIEDAGWEIRDMLVWGYASGFPKSLSPYRSTMAARCQSHERAPHAVQVSPWHPLGSLGVKAPTALALAETQPEGVPLLLIRTGEAGGSSAVTAMPLSEWTTGTSWNIGSSWNECWGDDWWRASTSTIETVASRITDPITSNSLTSLPTVSVTPLRVSRPDGCACDVLTVVESSTDGRVSMSGILWPSATEPATGPVARLSGLGTAAKPAWEPIVMARKPLRGTVAANVLRHGTGALNIDGTRIAMAEDDPTREWGDKYGGGQMRSDGEPYEKTKVYGDGSPLGRVTGTVRPEGRWPANVILTDPIFDGGIEGVVGGGETGPAGTAVNRNRLDGSGGYGGWARGDGEDVTFGDSGTYSRFFELPRGGLCEWCGASIAGPSSSPPSQPGATAPSDAATSPGGIWDSTAPEVESPTATDTNGTEPKSSPEPRPATTSPLGQPASPAEPSPTSTGTTTTTRMRGLCGPCAERATTENTLPPDWPSERGPLPVELDGHTRFLLVPKSARAEREPVLGGLEPGITNDDTPPGSPGSNSPRAGAGRGGLRQNVHPTVKPLDLMRHLVRLVTPPGGTVLDPFLGSGTTALAAEMEGFAWVGIEKEAEYVAITEARLNGTQRGLGLGA